MERISTGHRKYSLKALKPIHREILVRLCLCQTSPEICRELGVSRNTVSNAKCSALGKAFVAEWNRQVERASFEDIQHVSNEALRLVQQLIRGRVEVPGEVGEAYEVVPIKTRLDAAICVLDRNEATARVGKRQVSRKNAERGVDSLIARIRARAEQRPLELAKSQGVQLFPVRGVV